MLSPSMIKRARKPLRFPPNLIPILWVIGLSLPICYGIYWWHTNMRCISHGKEMQCTGDRNHLRCREVEVCDDWEPR